MTTAVAEKPSTTATDKAVLTDEQKALADLIGKHLSADSSTGAITCDSKDIFYEHVEDRLGIKKKEAKEFIKALCDAQVATHIAVAETAITAFKENESLTVCNAKVPLAGSQASVSTTVRREASGPVPGQADARWVVQGQTNSTLKLRTSPGSKALQSHISDRYKAMFGDAAQMS